MFCSLKFSRFCPEGLIVVSPRRLKKQSIFQPCSRSHYTPILLLVKGPQRLPFLLCLLLALSGAGLSASVACLAWIGAHSQDRLLLERLLPWAVPARLPAASYYLRLADLFPEHQNRYLSLALAADSRCLPARLGLALDAEFRGDRSLARQHIDAALADHKTYRTFMAALTQAARWGEPDRVSRLAREALRYCPRDAEGVFSQISYKQAREILATTSPSRQQEYFRFLIGNRRWAEALDYSSQWEDLRGLEQPLLELSEQLFWQGNREQSAQLFTRLFPEFGPEGAFNLAFERQPRSLAFDWRLTESQSARLLWRPGQLDISLAPLDKPLDLLSLLLDSRTSPRRLVLPVWTGQVSGLHWHLTTLSPGWQRAVLTASPGPARNFSLSGVRFK